MTRLFSTLALIGLVSVGPALADSSDGAQIFQRDAVAAQGGEAVTAPARSHARMTVGFDQADRSATSGR
jgi:hypothetical protein